MGGRRRRRKGEVKIRRRAALAGHPLLAVDSTAAEAGNRGGEIGGSGGEAVVDVLEWAVILVDDGHHDEEEEEERKGAVDNVLFLAREKGEVWKLREW